MSESDVTHCYRHDDRRAGVICQRCDKPICPDCMKQASVGFHCPACAKTGKQRVIRGPVAFDPVYTKVLIGINVAVMVISAVWGGRVFRLGIEPLREGALRGPLVADGEIYRIVTSAFLHDGLLHLGFNMFALWVLGSQLERLLQPPRFLALYMASLMGGALGVLLVTPRAFTVGASGAVFGLFGAAAVVVRMSGQSVWASGLGPILAINLLLTFGVPQISVGGHIGGLVAGATVGLLYVGAVRAEISHARAAAATWAMAVVLFMAAIWAAGL